DSSEVVVCRWKELGLYTDGRKVLDVDPQVLLQPFESFLRDYNVHYIVTVVSRGGLREYEQLFAQSTRYAFHAICRIANVEIVKVEKSRDLNEPVASDEDSSETGVRARFRRAIMLLEHAQPDECERILSSLPTRVRRQAPVIMNIGVAKEFEGELDQANGIFTQFRTRQQAGSFVQQSWYHLEIISKLKGLSLAQSAAERAQDLHFVAAYYWALGYQNQSLLTLDRSIAADSTFFPSMIFRSIYSLQNGDTAKSEYYLERSRRLDPTNTLVVSMSTILGNLKALHKPRDVQTAISMRVEIAHQLLAMGMLENAIDELLTIVQMDPSNQLCLRELAGVYDRKGRYAPELRYLRKLADLNPQDLALKGEVNDLLNRW
ncbi:MAG TPA: hypothetical protein VI758_07195, partial [Bacteroidota bacterium]